MLKYYAKSRETIICFRLHNSIIAPDFNFLKRKRRRLMNFIIGFIFVDNVNYSLLQSLLDFSVKLRSMNVFINQTEFTMVLLI